MEHTPRRRGPRPAPAALRAERKLQRKQTTSVCLTPEHLAFVRSDEFLDMTNLSAEVEKRLNVLIRKTGWKEKQSEND